ncbi:S9 family peptidase [Agaribacter flavus]|uniref:S9 family peptidase n=1 Tax=Agaribacter flavus TaxID=1902781 RepID=A0ABV7FRE0_9ALTE
MLLNYLRSCLAVSTMFVLTACSPAPDNATKNETSDVTKLDRLQALSITPPLAKQIPYTANYHGTQLSDPYHWLKDQDYPTVDDQAVLDYLNAENAYYQTFLEPIAPLVDKVFEEYKSRVNEEDSSVPWIKNGYEYAWRFVSGEEYRTYSRKHIETGEIIDFLSVSELAKGHDYFSLGDWDISPDNQLLAYTYNTNGDERYSVVVKNIATGEVIDTSINDTNGDIAFSADGKQLIFGELHPERWYTKSIKAQTFGSSSVDTITLYTETDDAFFLNFYTTRSEKFLVIVTGNSEATETRVVPANNLAAEPQVLIDRSQNMLSSTTHANGYFYILSNDKHVNFRLARVSDQQTEYENWESVIEGSTDLYLQDISAFKDFMVLSAREKGKKRIIVRSYSGEAHDVVFPEDVFVASFGNNSEFEQDFVRLRYESMITPDTIFDYNIESKSLITKKEQLIPSGYDKSQYITKRLMAPVRDGTLVPVSIVYKKDFKQDASHPMHLYGYGAYGVSVEPRFSTVRLSLLDRGFSFAIAHVRGSDMMGHQWYLDGKLDKRTNTFNDFVDVAKYLIAEKYVAEGNISASGRSAGGELMGAIVIQAPELWRSVTLGVPFVDVLNTMLDASLPLTPPEWSEWGNPIEDAEAYRFIQSYSPYDNIEKRAYPPMMVTGGLNDPRVTYWEPAKWTAKMRANKTDSNLLVMRINMGAGHFANSGRYGRLRDAAEETAFMLTAHGITQ